MKKVESIQKKNKISFWYSIKWKVMFLAILAVILTGVIGLLNSVFQMQKNVEDTATSFTVVEQGIISSMTSIQKIVAKVENLDNLRGDVVSSVKNLESIAQRNAGSTEKSSSSIVEINENISNISEQNQKLHEIVEKLNENIEEFKTI